jgi:hypothetical protein
LSGRLTVSAAWQKVVPYSSRRHPSSFVIAAYIRVRLIPQDCLPVRQVKSVPGALHLGFFEQPAENDFFRNLLMLQ